MVLEGRREQRHLLEPGVPGRAPSSPCSTSETTIRLSVDAVMVDGVVKLNVCCVQAAAGRLDVLARQHGAVRLLQADPDRPPVHVPLAKKLPVYLVDRFRGDAVVADVGGGHAPPAGTASACSFSDRSSAVLSGVAVSIA